MMGRWDGRAAQLMCTERCKAEKSAQQSACGPFKMCKDKHTRLSRGTSISMLAWCGWRGVAGGWVGSWLLSGLSTLARSLLRYLKRA